MYALHCLLFVVRIFDMCYPVPCEETPIHKLFFLAVDAYGRSPSYPHVYPMNLGIWTDAVLSVME